MTDSATDNQTTELCEMLDERGVKFETHDIITGRAVTWSGSVCNWVALPDEMGLAIAVYKDYLTPERAIAATLGSPTWRNSYDQQRHDRWYDSLFHGEPSSFKELIEDVIWTAETVDLGPNGNECQGVDEGEVNTEGMIATWVEKASTLGNGTCHIVERSGDWYCDSCGEMVGTCDPASELFIDGNAVELWNYCPNCGARIEKVNT